MEDISIKLRITKIVPIKKINGLEYKIIPKELYKLMELLDKFIEEDTR